MADGRTHQRINVSGILIVLPVLLGLTIFYSLDFVYITYLFWGFVFGLFVEPDLDQTGSSISETRVFWVFYRLFGKSDIGHTIGTYAQKIVQILWYPYAICLPHRSIHSHLPVWATSIRMIYVWVLYIIFTKSMFLVDLHETQTTITFLITLKESISEYLTLKTLLILIGASFVDWLHLHMDGYYVLAKDRKTGKNKYYMLLGKKNWKKSKTKFWGSK